MKNIFLLYEKASGQQVNFNKSSVVFSKDVPQQRRDEIIITLDVREVLSNEKYLRLPTHVGHSKKKAFGVLRIILRRSLGVG